MPKLTKEVAAFYRTKKVAGHYCSLNFEPDTVCNYVNSGYFIPLRRYIRKLCMVSRRDPRTKAYAKSLRKIYEDEKRHLELHFFMIHPFSDFNFFWQTVMTITHIISLIVIPILFMNRGSENIYKLSNVIVSVVLSLVCLVNVVLTFFIGNYDKYQNKIILNPKKVAITYLCTYFLFDLLSSLNYNRISNFTGLYRGSWFSRFQWALKLVRLTTINDYLDNVQSRISAPYYIYKTLKFCLFFIIIMLWSAFLIYSLDRYYMRKTVYMDLSNKITLTFNKNFLAFYQCNIFKEYYEVIHHIDLYLAIFCVHCGKFFEIWFLAQFFQAFASYQIVSRKYQTMLHQVEAFTRFKDLPKRICRRIFSYLNFRCQCLVFDEKTIINSLCVTLKDEILWHKCENLVTKVKTFAELPIPIKIKLTTMLKPEIYLPNDVVIQSGEVGSEMFFVYVGVLAVFTKSGKEICHLSDGSHFGEIALLLNETRVASVVAIDFCELYRLTKKDFHEAIEPYPLVKENIMKAAQERYKETRILSQQ